AVIDADDDGTGPEGAIHLLLRVNLDDRLHRKPGRQRLDVAQPAVVQHSDDQQHRVGADGARGEQLDGVDDEVLAEDRHVDGSANRLQVVEGATEEFRLRQHRDGGGAIGGGALGPPYG